MTVRVATGLRAGDEIQVLDAVLSAGAGCARTGQSASRDLSLADQAALADGTFSFPAYTGVAAGVHSVLVTARGRTAAGLADRASRCVVFSITANRVVLVPLSSCDGGCPSSPGRAELTECLNGRCVAPTCLLDDPATAEDCCDRALLGEACVETPTLCRVDDDCGASIPCAQPAACIEGACVEPALDGCGDGEYCDSVAGMCVARAPGPDAGGLDGGAPSDAGPPIDATRDARAPADAGRDAPPRTDAGPIVTGEDCVRLGDDDGDGDADCDDYECLGRAICVSDCAPRAATRAPGEGIPLADHWYRVDHSAVLTPLDRICALEDLSGGRPLLADPTSMPLLADVGVGAGRHPAASFDLSTWLSARGTDLDVDRDGVYAVFLVLQDEADGSYQPFTAGTSPDGIAFDLVSLRFEHSVDLSGGMRRLVAHGSRFEAGTGHDSMPHVLTVVADATPPDGSIASLLDYRFDGSAVPLVLGLGSGTVDGRPVTGDPTTRVGPGRFRLAELLIYARPLSESQILQVEEYLTTRYAP